MKEFVVYTVLRLLLFVGALGVVAGLWVAVTGGVDLFWAVVIAFVVSGVGSFVLLNRQREAFARRVEVRAQRATRAFEDRRTREDAE